MMKGRTVKIISNNQNFRNIFIISMISVFMGQFYISPFNIGFRLTLAVFFMSLFLIYFDNYNVIVITMSVGISTFVFRTLVFYLGSNMPFIEVVIKYIPVLFYYLFFGIFFEILEVRNYINKPFNFFLSLWICDSVPNIIEASIRKAWQISDFNELIVTIVIVGALRTISTLIAYYIVKHYYNRIKKNEREKYYREIIVFISKLKTELFILNKSRGDIEETVAYAHHCYDSIKDDEIKVPMLKIAKDIHEIKKDYLRVIASMNSIFAIDTNIRYMSIKDILSIVKDSALDLIQFNNKKIEVLIEYNELFITDKFYSIISILGNLAVNSIDAIDSYGEIRIKVNLGDNIVFTVKDSGKGIKKGKEEVIFNFGYTTKYDKETGKMSTGLGLAHVKSIITEDFNGSIRVESFSNMGAKFIVEIPKDEILRRDESDEVNLYSG